MDATAEQCKQATDLQACYVFLEDVPYIRCEELESTRLQ